MSTRILPFALLGLVACTTQMPSDDDYATIEGAATNRPLRNGCDATKSIGACMTLKGSTLSYVCAFRKRIPGAIFSVGYYNESDAPAGWTFEDYKREPDIRDTTAQLEDTCVNHASYKLRFLDPETPHVLAVFLPTQAKCKELNGTWTGGYCY